MEEERRGGCSVNESYAGVAFEICELNFLLSHQFSSFPDDSTKGF